MLGIKTLKKPRKFPAKENKRTFSKTCLLRDLDLVTYRKLKRMHNTFKGKNRISLIKSSFLSVFVLVACKNTQKKCMQSNRYGKTKGCYVKRV